MVGAILTAIVQSSSATLGITMGLAVSGVINFPTAAALVLGENIGTTITAMLASLGTTNTARRAALAHMIVNLLGVAWITIIFGPYTRFIVWLAGEDPAAVVYTEAGTTYPNVLKAIALTHTGFNVVNALIFMFLLGILAKFLLWLVPEKPGARKPHLTVLDVRMLDTPAIGIQQSQNEIRQMGESIIGMMTNLRTVIQNNTATSETEEAIFHEEKQLDVIQKEVTEFIGGIMVGNISHDVMNRGRQQLRIADELETISDYVTQILKLNIKLRKHQERITDAGLREILDLHEKVVGYIQFIAEAVQENDVNVLIDAQIQGNDITFLMKKYRSSHIARIESGHASPLKSLYYMDMLNAYRRIKDHAFNIAEVIAGEK
jgi:phosphate:Na+ symporter